MCFVPKDWAAGFLGWSTGAGGCYAGKVVGMAVDSWTSDFFYWKMLAI